LGSPKIVSTDVRVCGDTAVPCLAFEVRVEGINAGIEVYIPVDGRLYSDDGRFLSQVILDNAYFGAAGSIGSSTIIVNYLEKYPNGLQLTHTLDLKCRAFLDVKSINYIEERRRLNKYHRVELKLKLRFLALHSMSYHYDHIYRAGKDFPLVIRLPSDAVMLKSGKPLLYVEPQVYSELESAIIVDGPRWVSDFLPVLGLGNYVLLEIPLPKPPAVSDEALQHFINVVKSLKRAREALYETLDVGPSLTALRNSLLEFCEVLKSLGLASVSGQDRGCEINKEKLKELFQGSKELTELMVEIYTNVKRVATRGSEPTQPHIALKPTPTPYQVESLIGLASYMIKLVMDTYMRQQATT